MLSNESTWPFRKYVTTIPVVSVTKLKSGSRYLLSGVGTQKDQRIRLGRASEIGGRLKTLFIGFCDFG